MTGNVCPHPILRGAWTHSHLDTFLVTGRAPTPVRKAGAQACWPPLVDSFVVVRRLQTYGELDGTRALELVSDELQQAVLLGAGLQHHQVGLVGVFDPAQHDGMEFHIDKVGHRP